LDIDVDEAKKEVEKQLEQVLDLIPNQYDLGEIWG